MTELKYTAAFTIDEKSSQQTFVKPKGLVHGAARRFTKNPMFIAIVAIPNLLSLVYFLLIASPVYVSTSALTIFNPSQSSSNIVSLLSGGSSDGSAEEAYILRDYILSWTEFQKLSASLDLAEASSAGDFISRYGGLASLFKTNDVALWHYYQSHLNIGIDVKSGVVSINVEAYNSKFANQLSQQILKDAVAHMDAMNDLQEQDFVDDAKAQAGAARNIVVADEDALDNYRSRIGVYEPSVLYTSKLALLNALNAQETQLQAQYTMMVAAAPNSPSAGDMRKAIATIVAREQDVQATIPRIAAEAKTYETLLETRNDDESVLQQAAEAVQDAELKAQQNRYYLDIISAPSQPKTAELPKRLKWMMAVFFASIIIWGLLR